MEEGEQSRDSYQPRNDEAKPVDKTVTQLENLEVKTGCVERKPSELRNARTFLFPIEEGH